VLFLSVFFLGEVKVSERTPSGRRIVKTTTSYAPWWAHWPETYRGNINQFKTHCVRSWHALFKCHVINSEKRSMRRLDKSKLLTQEMRSDGNHRSHCLRPRPMLYNINVTTHSTRNYTVDDKTHSELILSPTIIRLGHTVGL